jgi:hypothetical protein
MTEMSGIETFSQDGSVVQAGSGGGVVTADGVWTFSTGKAIGGNYILLNGKWIGSGIGVELKVANGGKLYSRDAAGQWFQWSDSRWLAWVDPTLEATLSQDDSVVQAGSGGGVVTADGVWTFSTGKAIGGNYILLNGKWVGHGAGVELKVANGGKLYSRDVAGQWFQWNGAKWSAIVNPGAVVDTTAPVVSMALVADTGSSGTDQITSNPTVTGTGEANTVVTIKAVDGATLGMVTADDAGAWSFTPIGLADGAHTLTATQTDLAGNTGTATLSFTLDRTAPTVSIALVSDTGISASDNITSNPAVTGTGEANAVVTIKAVDGATLGMVTADDAGSWGFTPIGLLDGAHPLTATQTDLAGNTGTATLSFALYKTAPVVSIALVSDTGSSATDKITSNPAIQGTGQVNTPVTIKKGTTTLGTVTADSTGAWSFTPTGLADGAHTLTVTQIDLNGITRTATLSFTLDRAAPVVSMALTSDTGLSASDKITSNPAIKGTGQANTLVTIKAADGATLGTVTAGSTGAWSFTPTGLADGVHALTATQTDLAGNTGTATLSFTLDKTPPAVSIALVEDTGLSATDRVTSNPAVKGTGQVSTPVTIKRGTTTLGTVTADDTGAWSFTPTGLADGAHTLTASQTDHAGNTGTATLSFTLNTVLVAPTPPQPSQSDEIFGLYLKNTGNTVEKSGFVTFGQVFKTGAVMPGDSLVARIDGVDHAVQMEVKTTHSDGSVRHAVLTLKAPEIAPGGSVAVMLATGSAALPTSTAPSASELAASGYDVTVTFTFRNTDGTTTTESVSAAAVLQAAIDAGEVKYWLTGADVNEFDVVTTVNDGKLKVEFDIRAYADGTTKTDVIFDNSWMFSSGKSNLDYDVTISQGDEQVYSASNVSQYLYSLWHYQVDSADTINLQVQYDVSYLSTAAALPAYDQSFGISKKQIQTNYSKLDPSKSSGYGSTGPMGTALVETKMGNAGGRADIGMQPNWVVHWLLSQDSDAETVMMANADAAGGIPWHLVDENTGTFINNDEYIYFWQDPSRNVAGSYWSPQPVNGWPTYGNPWRPTTSHMPDLNYVPYLTTGSNYQLKLLQAAANYAITSSNPYYKYDGGTVDPGKPGDALFMGVASPGRQQRTTAWGLREVAEAAYITPDDDPLKDYFTSQLTTAMDGLVEYYITDDRMAEYGEIKGFIRGSEGMVATWQQGYIVNVLADIAEMDLPGTSDNAVQMLNYMTNFIAGLYTNEENGYDPDNGAAYWLYYRDPITKQPYTTWAELSDGNVASYSLNPSGWGLASADRESIGFGDLTGTMHGYAVIAKSAMANLITYTQSPRAIEAYGYITGQMAVAWAGNTAKMEAAYQTNPLWNVMPRLPDGEYLSVKQMQIDISNDSTVTLTATGGNSLLAVVGGGTATLIGGDGIDLLFGGSGPTTLIAGAGNDYLFAGKGATTFIDGAGDDYMKGGPGYDTFIFEDVNPGHDTIANFKPDEDVLQIASNLNNNGITSAEELIASASVDEGSTMLHLTPDHTVTIRGIDTPSSLLNSIQMI